MKEAYWHGFLDEVLRREAVAEEGIHNSTPCSTFVPQSNGLSKGTKFRAKRKSRTPLLSSHPQPPYT
jgi:hypothetical protein